jgi:hypothetical protein
LLVLAYPIRDILELSDVLKAVIVRLMKSD